MKILKTANKKLLATLVLLSVLLACLGQAAQTYEEPTVKAAGVVSMVISAVVLVLVASAMMPTIANSSKAASTALTTEGFTGAASISDQWVLGVTIAVFVAIFAFAI